MTIQVKVNTQASKTSIEKVGDLLVVKFNGIREKGKANKQLVEILAYYFKFPKSIVRITSGKTSKIKTVKILDLQ
jgi:uncharacterized protein (TIGR00251 family)